MSRTIPIQPTTSVHSVGSQGRRYSDADQDLDDALMEDANFLEDHPDDMDEQTVYSLTDDGRMLKKKYSRSQVLQDEKVSQKEENESYDEEVFILPQKSAPILQDVQRRGSRDKEHKDVQNDRSCEIPIKSIEGRPYQHEVNKPIMKVGTTQITLSEAKLFGLVNKDGKICLTKKPTSTSSVVSSLSLADQRKYINSLSQPPVVSTEEFLDPSDAPTFQPKRSEAAQKAMRNPRCGYDFMDRLDSRGAFLERVDNHKTSNQGRVSKSQMEAMEQDYDAKFDKLQCPKCLQPQTFKEFFEKQRICTRCQLKFEKLNVTSGSNFLKKNAEREKERLTKLRVIEAEMYGSETKSQRGANLNNKEVLKDRLHTKQPKTKTFAASSVLSSDQTPAVVGKSQSQKTSSGRLSKTSAQLRPQTAQAKLNKTDFQDPRVLGCTSQIDASAIVEQMVKLNNEKAAVLNRTFDQFQLNSHDRETVVQKEQHIKSRHSRSAGKPPLAQPKMESPRRESSKFDRLVNF